jgi:hypothetical protein
MWKVTLGYGSFPPSQSGGLATGVGGGGGRGRVWLQQVDPWEFRPEALNAPCFFNLRQSNKTNSSDFHSKIIPLHGRIKE